MKNVAIIGCGRISYKHIEAINNNQKDCRLIALCDILEQKAKEKRKQYEAFLDRKQDNINIYIDYKEILKDDNIDIVSISTESGKHAQIAIDCMNAGKHVIVEKPMAMNLKDVDRMIDVAEKNNVKLCVCHQNRFNPAVQKLRKMVQENKFGKIFSIHARILWNRGRDYYEQAPWRGTFEQDGGCLMNQCIHNIDLLQWMANSEPVKINAMLENYNHPYIEAEDYGSIQIRFKNGIIGNIEGTVCVYPKNLEETLTILGEKGTVVIGGKAVNKIYEWDFKDSEEALEEVQKECNQEIESVYGYGHTPLYKNFIESIESDKAPYIDGYEGRKALEIILKAYEQR